MAHVERTYKPDPYSVRGRAEIEQNAILVLEAEVERLRSLMSDAESWFEEIQHVGYAVPTGREAAFDEFWDALQREEARHA